MERSLMTIDYKCCASVALLMEILGFVKLQTEIRRKQIVHAIHITEPFCLCCYVPPKSSVLFVVEWHVIYSKRFIVYVNYKNSELFSQFTALQ